MKSGKIGCVLMASGLSIRYGKNKLLETLGGRALILHAADRLSAAGLAPLAVARSAEVAALLRGEGVACVLHDGAKKSDTMRVGLQSLGADVAGVLFMPADQPLVLPPSLKKLVEHFDSHPARAVRLGFGNAAGSPVLFPAALIPALLAYEGDRGGSEVLRRSNTPCDVVQAAYEWELWDADTPEMLERLRTVYNSVDYFNCL